MVIAPSYSSCGWVPYRDPGQNSSRELTRHLTINVPILVTCYLVNQARRNGGAVCGDALLVSP